MKDFDDAPDFDLQSELEALQPYVSPTGSREEVMRQMESCPVCGSQLQFTYFADFTNLTTNEVVRCPECNYRARKGHRSLN